MAKRFCRYCDNPFVGDYQAGIADFLEQIDPEFCAGCDELHRDCRCQEKAL